MSERETDTASRKAIRIAIHAMGGEGGGVLANWIVDLGEHNGHIAQMTSVPGVAQRTGATIYYVELFPESADKRAKAPVLALMPVPGDVDIVIASELMETGRAIQRGFVTPDRTTLIASTNRVFAMTEKIMMADGRVDDSKLLEAARAAAKRLVALDMAEVAAGSGAAMSAVMFGALAGAKVLPFTRAQFEATIERGGLAVTQSKRGFGAAFDAAASPAAGGSVTTADATAPMAEPTLSGEALALIAEVDALLPPAARAFAREGVRRQIDFQDAAYARLYVERLKAIAAIDTQCGRERLSTETARYLALGMAYEDTIRVAELKTRRDRFRRVEQEVGLKSGQVLEIAEFLHPRLQEVAETVPAPLGRFILRNAIARRVVGALTSSGKVVKTTSLGGFLLLYTVAGLKSRRRSNLRYSEEQASLEAWLGDIQQFAKTDYELACEIAECRNLVKGYGDTHARGKASYDAILGIARTLAGTPAAASAIARLRRAAVDDDSGKKLADAVMALEASRATARADHQRIGA